jgi:hypothetical protein
MKLVQVRDLIYRLDAQIRPKTKEQQRIRGTTALVIAFIAAAVLLFTLISPYFT